MHTMLERGFGRRNGLRRWCAGLIAGLAIAGAAVAVPVNVSFDGQLSDIEAPLASSFAVGTPVSWSVNFDYLWDDREQPTSAEWTLTGVRGWLKLGAWDYVLSAGSIASYQYQLSTGLVNWIQFEIEGTGPSLPNAYFGGLFLRIDADRQYMDAWLQYAFPVQSGEAYFYMDTEGNGRVTALNDVPEPATAALALAALLGCGWTTRRRRAMPSA